MRTLANHSGLATHVLRHRETVGFLAPVRDSAGRRRQGLSDVTRVAVVLRGEAEALRSRVAAAQASSP